MDGMFVVNTVFFSVVLSILITAESDERRNDEENLIPIVGSHEKTTAGENVDSGRNFVFCNTTTGRLKGEIVLGGNGKNVIRYLGVPFAEPPVGLLRFRKPVAKTPWQGIREATSLPNACAQYLEKHMNDNPGVSMWNPENSLSEDCLYMNIWTPYPKPANVAVMVWIHGGGFFGGSASLDVYDGSILASEADVIVIAIQYRLGFLGFFYYDSTESPGNQGMFDQIMALQWIQENIVSFGGDDKKVTLFGSSAGAACVGLHLLSPYSSGLFSRAILQSGAPSTTWASTMSGMARERAETSAEELGCVSPDRAVAMSCMRNVSVAKLTEQIPGPGDPFDYISSPVIDGDFLPRPPLEMIKNGRLKVADVLIGTTSNEGSVMMLYSFPSLFQTGSEPNASLSVAIDAVSKLMPDLNLTETTDLLSHYTEIVQNWSITAKEPTTVYFSCLAKLLGDKGITCEVYPLVEQLTAMGANVYKYEFAHVSANTPWPTWIGAHHNIDVAYVFGMPLRKSSNFTHAERELSKRLMKYWANFAKTGNPNQPVDGHNDSTSTLPNWPPYSTEEKMAARLTDHVIEIHRDVGMSGCAIWDKLSPTEKYASFANLTMLASVAGVEILSINSTSKLNILEQLNWN